MQRRLHTLYSQQKLFSRTHWRGFSTAAVKPKEVKGDLLKGRTGSWEVVIGLEIHCQLDTKSKLFSSAPGVGPDSIPNHRASIIDAAFPGVLPVLNKACVDRAVRMGLALSGKINTWSSFDRKHYFYFDMPQGYQITQYHEPIVRGGKLSITMPDQSTKDVRITQIQLEQDSAKSIHDQHPDYSLIDLNRAGSALIEIVTEADMRSSMEAFMFIKKLQHLVRHVGVSTANMEEGEFRCDVNVSVNRPGESWGTRTEIKNINSIRNAMKAIDYEAKRHIDLIESGGKVVKQTRYFDGNSGVTVLMREKEEEMDYRFMPEPDLPPLYVPENFVEEIKSHMPELPDVTRDRLLSKYGLSPYDADILIDGNAAQYFEQVAINRNPKKVAAWIINEIFGYLNETQTEEIPISVARLGSLIDLVESGQISGRAAKEVLTTMYTDSRDPTEIVKEKGLSQMSDESALQALCEQAIKESPGELAKYKAGRDGVFRHFVAKVMQYTKGKANPKRTAEILKEMIDKMPK